MQQEEISHGFQEMPGGGAGNPGGAGKYNASGQTGSNTAGYYGATGTGGLLIVYANTVENNGILSSNGVSGGAANSSGGSSGGGSVNIFAKTFIKEGIMQANGGPTVTSGAYGGAGGNGTTTTTVADLTMPTIYHLNYPVKSGQIHKNEIYNIDKSKLEYVTENNAPNNLSVGRIEFSSENEEIVTVDSNGKIIAKAKGIANIIITDIDNHYSTSIEMEIIDGNNPNIALGEDFTVALKSNGTLWSFGSNAMGQLGTGDEQNHLEPTKIELSDVYKIGAGHHHVIALTYSGEVYVWGDNTYGQLGNGSTDNANIPIKVDGLPEIIKVDAYKNKSIALSKDGQIYIWGEGYSSFPMKIVSNEIIADIAGTLALTAKGTVYDVTKPEQKINVGGIHAIKCGQTHNLALSHDGEVYEWSDDLSSTARFGMIDEKVTRMSAGENTSMVRTETGKVYVWGSNADGRIGLGTQTANAEPQLVDGIEAMQVGAGEGRFTEIVKTDGFVWNTGINTSGQLGTGNTTNKTTYSQIGKTIVTTDRETIVMDRDESTQIKAKLENTFNLLIDIVDEDQSHFTMTCKNNLLDINGMNITAKEYGEEELTITHNETGISKTIVVKVVLKLESLVQGVRDTDLSDGNYLIAVQDEEYRIEVINVYGDTIYDQDVILGDDTTDYKTLVVKYHGDLTIKPGVTVTAKNINNLTYKKGMYLCVLRKRI